VIWLVAWCLLTLGFVFLARDAEATGFVRRCIARRAEEGRLSTSTCYNFVSRFLDALLACAPCTAAWSSILAAAVVAGLYYLADSPWIVAMLVVACPVGAVGLLYGFTLLSPSQAMAAALAGLGRLKGKADAAKKDTTS